MSAAFGIYTSMADGIIVREAVSGMTARSQRKGMETNNSHRRRRRPIRRDHLLPRDGPSTAKDNSVQSKYTWS